jgi:hypothetical protein
MIHYVTARRMVPAMRDFLERAGRPLAKRLRIVSYPALFRADWRELPRGAWIFTALGSDLGSFEPPSPARAAMARLHAFLVAREGAERVLNHPMRYLRRYALLRALLERGINDFAAWRAGDPFGAVRYPVFLRREQGSASAPLTLLHSRAELDAALAALPSREGSILVEFSDTADASGIYRKYGAFVVGQRIVPRHVFFSRGWQVKRADLAGPAQIEEELAYLQTNPHERFLLEVSRLAGISYGRIDYGLRAGRPQVWEINVTPAILSPAASESEAREPVTRHFVKSFAEALAALEPGAAPA